MPRSHIQQANALLVFSRSSLSVLGPSVAALVVVTAGAGWAIAADALTWAVAAACMSRLKLANAARVPGERPSMLRDLKEGWVSFTELTWVWVVVVAFGIMNALLAAAFFTLGPTVARETIGIDGRGYLLSSEAV